MIWIATICILAVFAWLLLNAFNERRWVEANQDDENVAADQGLVPSYSQLNRSDVPEERYSIHKQDSSIGRFATSLKAKTSSLGDKIERTAIEKSKNTTDLASGGASGIKAGGRRSWSEVGNSLVGDNSMIGRATDKVSKKALELGEKLPTEKLKPVQRDKSASAAEPNGRVGRFIKDVSNRIEEIDRKVDV